MAIARRRCSTFGGKIIPSSASSDVGSNPLEWHVRERGADGEGVLFHIVGPIWYIFRRAPRN